MLETVKSALDTSTQVVAAGHADLETIRSLVSLMLTATIVGVIAARIKLPYTVSLVLVGIGLNALGILPNLRLTHDLLLMVFLPALLFEAAIHFPANELKQFAPTILVLAAPGVLLTAIATALVLQLEVSTFRLMQPVGFRHFLLFGTIIAATDPISVISLLRQLGVNRRLSILIEGESLFNDGTAIVLYSVMLDMITMDRFNLSTSLVQLVVVSMGGIFIGAVLGLFASLMISFIEDHLFSIAITTVTAYGAYLIAEEFEVSGILATVVAGLFVGNMGKRKSMNPTTRIAVTSFWEYLAFFISSIVFLMMGLEVNLLLLLNYIELIIFAFCAVLASRAVSVYLPIPFLKRFNQDINYKNGTVLWWAGLRGSLSMVLVLSLPADMEVRETLIAMTFGVVVLSVVLQGSTIGLLLKWLDLVPKRTAASIFLAKNLARLKAIKAQTEAVSQMAFTELPVAKKISLRLKTERAEILEILEEKSQDPEFLMAATDRINTIENHLENIAKASYRESLESSLLTDKDMQDLMSKAAISSDANMK
jgi:monovalent cation:H+ antiporter, CPA1 family